MTAHRPISFLSAALCVALCATPAAAAPKPDLWARWQAQDSANTMELDHGPWSAFLHVYVNTKHPSGIYRMRYSAVTEKDHSALRSYLEAMQSVRPTALRREEQKAYWINLYNAATVLEVLDHYPVASIREIRSGWFSPGPWDKPLLLIEGEPLSLNDRVPGRGVNRGGREAATVGLR